MFKHYTIRHKGNIKNVLKIKATVCLARLDQREHGRGIRGRINILKGTEGNHGPDVN